MSSQRPTSGAASRRCSLRTAVRIGAPLLLLLALCAAALPAHAEKWLCPECPNEVVDRAPGAKELVCPKCGKTYTQLELSPALAYINSRTRDTEVTWIPQADDCLMFRLDGVEALTGQDHRDSLWVPWTAVDWYIPRMRILKLKDGREMMTDYPKNPDCQSPPRFVFETVDSTAVLGQKPTPFTEQRQETLAELFIVAFSPEGRDSARARFIEEVEAGRQPRLPRTQPKLMAARPVTIPPDQLGKGFKGETTAEVRVHHVRGVLAAHLLSSCGNEKLDSAAMQAVRYSSYLSGGEMGVAVPAWLRVRVVFEGDAARIVEEPAPGGFWRP